MSLRGIERTFSVARQSVASWLKKAQALVPTPLPGPDLEGVLEPGGMWSFV